MSEKRYPKRVLPLAVTGARTNNGAVLENASARQWIEGKQVACVGDTLIDPIDGEVTIVSGLDRIKDHGKAVAALGSVLSNGSFIVDAGQSHLCWAEYEEGCGAMPVAKDALATGGLV